MFSTMKTAIVLALLPCAAHALSLRKDASSTQDMQINHMLRSISQSVIKANKQLRQARIAEITHNLHTAEWSQIGQDKWVINQNAVDFKGFYLDIGAHDGKDMSNTQLLDQKGWQGVCVEAEPTNFESRTCTVVKTVVTDRTGDEVQFDDCKFTGTDGGNGGLSGIDGLGHNARPGCGKKTFTTTSIRDVIEVPERKIPPVIDYVSLDIEGAELLVLKSFPFDKHCVRLWTIEHNHEEPKKTNIRDFMTEKGCTLKDEKEVDFLFTCSC